ncbi:MAG: riboflavin biosynthesis protein RibF [Candidatus Eisenbacteria bacterium]|nr:riboflavin biosynthesis protein RibF [Candidatus Eisenbacteria bacterium]
MRTVRDVKALAGIDTKDLTLTVGNFDGVHRGHREVLSELKRSAASRGTPAVVVTFAPHPLQIVGRRAPMGLLSPGTERERLIEAEDADLLVVVEFTECVASLSAEAFLRLISVGTGSHLVLGYDFHMGAGRACDIHRMGAIGQGMGFGLDVVPPVSFEGRPVSSSRIREQLAAGELRSANAMLGRAYELAGDVVSGAGHGTELGYPTLNLALPDLKLLPADGVYVARVHGTGPAETAGLVYVGRRPTIDDDGTRRAEVHLPGGPPERTERLSAELLTLLRRDRTYASKDQLAAAIGRDVAEARRLLEEGPEDWRAISF